MDITSLLESEIFVPALSGVFGVLLTLITQRLLNKRSVFSYTVTHNRVGWSVEDAIYGSVKVTWNNAPVNRLYLSTVEVKNQSMKDHESVVMRVFSNDTILLTDATRIGNGIEPVDLTEEYKNKLTVSGDSQPTEEQRDLYHHRRDYFVPVINRGQSLRFELLNAPHTKEEPTVWLDILHKGVICKFQAPSLQIMGVPQPTVIWAGITVSALGVSAIVALVENLPLVAFLSLAIGWSSAFSGAHTIKLYRRIRDWFVG